MPRYFFNIFDGHSIPDADGCELPDIAAARAMAIRVSGEAIREMGAEFWNGEEWKLEVTNEGGKVLSVLRFSADAHE